MRTSFPRILGIDFRFADRFTLPVPVLRLRIRRDPHFKRPPESGSAWRDADPDQDPGGKKSLENVQVH